MTIDTFLKGAGALVIGLLFAAALKMPLILIGVVLGWFFIQETLDENNS